MSKLAEFRRAEQALKEQLALLEKLQGVVVKPSRTVG